MRERWGRYLSYAGIALLVGAMQLGAFDCNELPGLSFGAAFLAVLTALVAGDAVYRVNRSTRGTRARVGLTLAIGVGGGAVALALGALTLLSHMCG